MVNVKGNSFNGKTTEEDPYYLQTLREGLLPCKAQGLLILRVWQEQANEKLRLDIEKTKNSNALRFISCVVSLAS